MGRKSNYENGIFNQLEEIMNRLDSVESELRTEKKENKEDVDRLNKKIDSLSKENSLLRNDNAECNVNIIRYLRKNSEETKHTPHHYAKAEEKTLLNRLDKYSHNHLLFLCKR